LRDSVNKKDVEAWRASRQGGLEIFRAERSAACARRWALFERADNVKVVVTKTLQGDGFTVECLIYESGRAVRDGESLRSQKTDKPMPGFIVIHSHHNPKTQGELQDMA